MELKTLTLAIAMLHAVVEERCSTQQSDKLSAISDAIGSYLMRRQ